jgi:hypothetical protein
LEDPGRVLALAAPLSKFEEKTMIALWCVESPGALTRMRLESSFRVNLRRCISLTMR